MTAYRFRVKFDPDPTSLWRAIVVGADRTIAELQSAINPAVGLNQGHLWFIGEDEDYWDSAVKYQCPQEYKESLGGDPVLRTERTENAGDVTIGEMFFLPCEENFNSDTTIRLLDALQTEFGEKLCVVLDNASYFMANKVQEFAEDTPIELCYLPRGSALVNHAGECWRKLNQALGNRLFDTLDELQEAALAALDDIKPPNVFTYLCP